MLSVKRAKADGGPAGQYLDYRSLEVESMRSEAGVGGDNYAASARLVKPGLQSQESPRLSLSLREPQPPFMYFWFQNSKAILGTL